MDDSKHPINREALLVAGGASALAALIALVADPAAAETPTKAKPKHKAGVTPFEVPLGLDINGPGGVKKAKRTLAATVSSASHVKILNGDTQPIFLDPQPSIIYKLVTADISGPVPYEHGHKKCDSQGTYTTVWIAVWTP